MSESDQKAFNEGYECYQKRRGLNPYPMTINGTAWESFERGWAQAYVDNAPDLSRITIESRYEATGLECYKAALEARNPTP